jgi:penicillin-insensitive murein endopeptidase
VVPAVPAHGLTIERIIVAPEYVDRVLIAGGRDLASLSGQFMRRPAWVRHDEHVHVDFKVAGKNRRGMLRDAEQVDEADKR